MEDHLVHHTETEINTDLKIDRSEISPVLSVPAKL